MKKRKMLAICLGICYNIVTNGLIFMAQITEKCCRSLWQHFDCFNTGNKFVLSMKQEENRGGYYD